MKVSHEAYSKCDEKISFVSVWKFFCMNMKWTKRYLTKVLAPSSYFTKPLAKINSVFIYIEPQT